MLTEPVSLFHCFSIHKPYESYDILISPVSPVAISPTQSRNVKERSARRGPLRGPLVFFFRTRLFAWAHLALSWPPLSWCGSTVLSLFPSSKALLYRNSRGFPAMCWSKQHWQTKALPSRPCSQGLEAAVFRQFSFSPVTKVQRIYIECQAHPCQKFL